MRMTDYLKKLFELELDSGRLGLRQTPGFPERRRRLGRCHERISAALGQDFLERFNDLEAEDDYYAQLACFRHGFRLALRLVLDLPW